MSSDVAVILADVSKAYPIYQNPQDPLLKALYHRTAKLPFLTRSLRDGLQRKASRLGREFYALHHISFQVNKGESVGIIGRNGSGKSTLLQIIAGTLTPTSGDVTVNGQVAALLELGSGFNPEFTGRENVYLSASLMGFSGKETDARFDEIAAFADIGDFLDQPVKTYSSGMMIRLAFAVQTAVEPDILIIDEALSVGDFFFQQKCATRIRRLRERGTTLLFVSHDMGAVRSLCSWAAYLRRGKLLYYGNCQQAITLYFQEDTRAEPSGDTEKSKTRLAPVLETWDKFRELACWMNESKQREDDQPARLQGVALLDTHGKPTMKVVMGQGVTFWVLIQHYSPVPMSVAITLKNRYDQIVSTFGSYTLGLELPTPRTGSSSLFELKMVAMLEAGLYSFGVTIGEPGSSPNRGTGNQQTPWLGPFTISWDYDKAPAPFLGMFGVPVSGAFRDAAELL